MTPSTLADAARPRTADPMRRALAVGACLVAAGALGQAARERAQRGRIADPPHLEANIPKAFANWSLLTTPSQIVNPQAQQMLDAIYSEVVSRTYVDANRYHVMLSVAYGSDQRGGLEAHKPEVCYPAQGFSLLDQQDGVVSTPHGDVGVRLLRTSLGARLEPITYWFAMANTVNATAWDKRLARVRMVLTGSIPDGILLRVSSIDPDAARAYRVQAQFIRDLIDALPEPTRLRVLGRAAAQA